MWRKPPFIAGKTGTTVVPVLAYARGLGWFIVTNQNIATSTVKVMSGLSWRRRDELKKKKKLQQEKDTTIRCQWLMEDTIWSVTERWNKSDSVMTYQSEWLKHFGCYVEENRVTIVLFKIEKNILQQDNELEAAVKEQHCKKNIHTDCFKMNLFASSLMNIVGCFSITSRCLLIPLKTAVCSGVHK